MPCPAGAPPVKFLHAHTTAHSSSSSCVRMSTTRLVQPPSFLLEPCTSPDAGGPVSAVRSQRRISFPSPAAAEHWPARYLAAPLGRPRPILPRPSHVLPPDFPLRNGTSCMGSLVSHYSQRDSVKHIMCLVVNALQRLHRSGSTRRAIAGKLAQVFPPSALAAITSRQSTAQRADR